MKNEMMERVARALYEKTHNGPIPTKWEMVNALGGEHVWRDLARVAIEALREPTREMCVAGMKVNNLSEEEGLYEFLCENEMAMAWIAMIDEALK